MLALHQVANLQKALDPALGRDGVFHFIKAVLARGRENLPTLADTIALGAGQASPLAVPFLGLWRGGQFCRVQCFGKCTIVRRVPEEFEVSIRMRPLIERRQAMFQRLAPYLLMQAIEGQQPEP